MDTDDHELPWLGIVGLAAVLVAIGCFFDPPWKPPVTDLGKTMLGKPTDEWEYDGYGGVYRAK